MVSTNPSLGLCRFLYPAPLRSPTPKPVTTNDKLARSLQLRPTLKLQTDKDVYQLGDLAIVTVEISNSQASDDKLTYTSHDRSLERPTPRSLQTLAWVSWDPVRGSQETHVDNDQRESEEERRRKKKE
jgi:hypothetical protein